MESAYTIAILVAIITFLAGYTLFIPKSNRKFIPGTEESRNNNPALKLFGVIGDDIFSAMPAYFDKRRSNRGNQKIESLLRRSGNPWKVSAEEFQSFRFISAFIGFIISIPVALMVTPIVNLPWWSIVIAITVFAFFIPLIKYRELADERDVQFKRELPEALDLMTISLSGGDTFDNALKQTIPNMKDGIVKAEFEAMVRIINAGGTTHEALEQFAKRSPSDGVLTFVRSVQSALEVNSPLAEILESRAQASREEFFALVAEKTAQLQSRMIIYLAPTLLPALLIVIVAPSIAVFNSFM